LDRCIGYSCISVLVIDMNIIISMSIIGMYYY